MTQRKADCEALMNWLLPFARQMLEGHGEFFPFGAAMRPDGQLVPVASYEDTNRPRSADLIRLIKDGFVGGARRGEYKATALVYDVTVKLPSSGETSDAIAISLNHRDNYSVIVLFPYRLNDGRLTVDSAYAEAGEADIFGPN